jgi:septum formation protein
MKVRDVAARRGSGLIAGADTIVVAGTEVLGKPSSEREGRAMLRALNGRWHEVITGVALMDCATGRMASGFTSSKVHFRRMSSREISWYIATGEYRDKAGAYGVQGYAALFIDRIEGCYFNIVGFPVALFEKLCRKLGVDLLGHSTAGS